jgi:hypothetical protein
MAVLSYLGRPIPSNWRRCLRGMAWCGRCWGGVFAVRERHVCEVVDPVGEQFVGVFVERLYSDSVRVVLLWVDGAGASLTSSRLT